MKKRKLWIIPLLCAVLFLTGCSIEKTDSKKIRDLDFTILEDSQIPEELGRVIEDKKKDECKLTYTDGEALYIVIGYGTQKTGGYSISVDQLYLTGNAIYIGTTLIGPAKGETINEVESFPYIVVKTGFLDKNVVFD